MKNKKNYSRSIKNWEYLINHFTPQYIENMSDMREYVIGHGLNKSFCYLVEVGTKEIGDIRGATSSKFGLWYGTHGNDKELKYRATAKYFNGDIDNAFQMLKVEISNLIKNTQQLAKFEDLPSILSPMFKYKIMYLYNKEIMLPCFVLDDLQHFEDCLGLIPSKTFEKAQENLMNYKLVKMADKSNYDFSCWLYDTFGKYRVSLTRELNNNEDNKLNNKLFKAKQFTDSYLTHPVDKVELKTGTKGAQYYPRDVKVAAIALSNANYKCETDDQHECFIKRSNNLPYTEVHHLIPLAYHYKFDKSLDIPENIISLCSNCHNKIHYGKDADQLIKKFYELRKDKLHQAGIDLTLESLLQMYYKIDMD